MMEWLMARGWNIFTKEEDYFPHGLLQYHTSLKNSFWTQILQIFFVYNIHFSCPIILKFCIEYGSTTAVLCAKFKIDRATEK